MESTQQKRALVAAKTAGFAINLASAIIAHISVGDGPEAWSFAAATSVLWGLSYFLGGAGALRLPAVERSKS